MDQLVCDTTIEVLEAIGSKKPFVRLSNTITNLHLGGKSIDSSGASVLSDSLKSNTTLTTLNLHSNKIDSSGASSLSDSLKSNSTLTTLSLGANRIGHQVQ